MKLSLRNLFAAAGLLVAAAGLGRAEEISLAPGFEPFADQDITLVGHHAEGCETGACNAGGCDPCNSCCTSRHVGRDFWVCSDRCGGLVGGGELLYLRPYGEGGIFDTAGGGPDIGFNPAVRGWGGYENSDGLGARGRFFWYEGEDDGVLVGAPATQRMEIRYIDAEVTQAVAFRRSTLQLSGGVRYAETEFGLVQGGTAFPANVQLDFQGYGLTFALQGNRDLTRNGCLRVSSNARWSLLYGDFEGSGVVGPVPVADAFNRDDLINILELNIGPQFRHRMNSGGYLTAGVAAEAQYWSNGIDLPVAIPGVPPLAAGSYDFGLFGFSASVQITR